MIAQGLAVPVARPEHRLEDGHRALEPGSGVRSPRSDRAFDVLLKQLDELREHHGSGTPDMMAAQVHV